MNKIEFTQLILDSNGSEKSVILSEENGDESNKGMLFKEIFMDKNTSKAHQYSYFDLFKNRILFKHLIVCSLFGSVIILHTIHNLELFFVRFFMTNSKQ